MLEDYVVIDLEMTGLNAKTDAILEVGAVRVRDGRQTETYGAILKCGLELSERVVELTGITPEMAADGREPEEAMQEFFTFPIPFLKPSKNTSAHKGRRKDCRIGNSQFALKR